MIRADAAEPVPVCVKFSAKERRLLAHRAHAAGLPLVAYIRERVLAEAGCEDHVLLHIVEELATVARDNRRAAEKLESEAKKGASQNPSAQRDRIAMEVRESLTQQEIVCLAEFLKPAFDAGLWPLLRETSATIPSDPSR